MTSEEAAQAELIRQIKHFVKLGEGKPPEHEYNITALGLQNLLADRPTNTKTVQVWTCEVFSTSASQFREAFIEHQYGEGISDAAERCSCLKQNCPAALVEVTFSAKRLKLLTPDETQEAIKNGN